MTTTVHATGLDLAPADSASDTPVVFLQILPYVTPMADSVARPLRVALVNMPFNSTRFPSMQLGLLQAIAKQHGHAVTTHYLNMQFAARVGWDMYEVISTNYYHLLGEWTFARAAFREDAPDAMRLFDTFADDLAEVRKKLGCDIDFLLDLRERIAPVFIEECLERVDWQDYDVVGFSSVFEQNCAALALARRLKERHPDLVTVFGGANFEDEMGLEYVRTLPWVDYAVIGEGDDTFPALLARLAAGADGADLPGVARRTAGGVSFAGRPPLVRDLDVLPTPDYAEYFAAAAALQLPGNVRGSPVVVPFESARGCWWGQKHHCTFCGLNGMGMAYRSKSPARVVAELDDLAGRHGVYTFSAVDNILDHRYIAEVFGPLTERRTDYAFFWAVKANLSREQIRALARGGVHKLQPGIESLSTHVLGLMRKGTTALQNVRFLKWAAYYGVSVAWNVLMGFPGETAADYDEQLAIMRLIPHLEPPETATRILLERFSPNFTGAEVMGFRNVRADRAYACIYPDSLDHDRIAYFFDCDAPGALPDEVHAPVREYARRWKAVWSGGVRRPYLVYLRGAGRLTVLDGRGDPTRPEPHVFDEAVAVAYEACGPTAHGVAQVLEALRGRGIDADAGEVRRTLEGLVARGLMLEEDGRYLSLALPSNPNW